MIGRQEVGRLKRQLDRTFAQISQIPETEYELRHHLSRYLCVRVSGYLEKALQELAMDRCRRGADRVVQSYARSRLERFTNPDTSRIVDLVSAFDKTWGDQASEFIVNEKKEAINSINGLRNAIAHGQDVGSVTYIRVKEYYEEVESVVQYVANLFDPRSPGI